tara:strand:- start:724 stop:1839 length:1116 start_codon:yes stop_codon:yes gene_type:complete
MHSEPVQGIGTQLSEAVSVGATHAQKLIESLSEHGMMLSGKAKEIPVSYVEEFQQDPYIIALHLPLPNAVFETETFGGFHSIDIENLVQKAKSGWSITKLDTINYEVEPHAISSSHYRGHMRVLYKVPQNRAPTKKTDSYLDSTNTTVHWRSGTFGTIEGTSALKFQRRFLSRNILWNTLTVDIRVENPRHPLKKNNFVCLYKPACSTTAFKTLSCSLACGFITDIRSTPDYQEIIFSPLEGKRTYEELQRFLVSNSKIKIFKMEQVSTVRPYILESGKMFYDQSLGGTVNQQTDNFVEFTGQQIENIQRSIENGIIERNIMKPARRTAGTILLLFFLMTIGATVSANIITHKLTANRQKKAKQARKELLS